MPVLKVHQQVLVVSRCVDKLLQMRKFAQHGTGTTTMSGLTESGQPLTITSPVNLVTTTICDVMGRKISATLAVDTEVISYNLDATTGYEFFRVLDCSRDALGRDSGWPDSVRPLMVVVPVPCGANLRM